MKFKIAIGSGLSLLLGGVVGLLFSDNIAKKTKRDINLITYIFGTISAIGAFTLAFSADKFLAPEDEEEEENAENNEVNNN